MLGHQRQGLHALEQPPRRKPIAVQTIEIEIVRGATENRLADGGQPPIA
jgi:hypothetical protein